MRWEIVLLGLTCGGCQIDVLGDWGSNDAGPCEPTSCGGDQARLLIAVPMAEGEAERTDLWLSVCHGGQCANDVRLEWSCASDGAFCDLACSASAPLLGGQVDVRRGGPCGDADGAIGICVELELPTAGLSAGASEVQLVLDDARSGRRVIDGAFAIELAEVRTQGCAGPNTCLNGKTEESVAAFDPETAPLGAHELALAKPALSVSTAERHSCGTRADGTLSCWGDLPGPAGQTIVPSGSFQSIGTGYFQDCALGLDGIVTCFGNASLAGRALEPPPGVFRQIAVGPSFGCGLRPSGRVECWGDHACKLPNAHRETEIDRIVVGTSGTTLCALRTDGSALCSGDWNLALPDARKIAVSSEQLCRLAADGSAHCRLEKDDAESDHPGPFVELVAGVGHACGLAEDGTVTCFGANAPLIAATPSVELATLSSSDGHVCGITSAGSVLCWGDDDSGQATPPPDFP